MILNIHIQSSNTLPPPLAGCVTPYQPDGGTPPIGWIGYPHQLDGGTPSLVSWMGVPPPLSAGWGYPYQSLAGNVDGQTPVKTLPSPFLWNTGGENKRRSNGQLHRELHSSALANKLQSLKIRRRCQLDVSKNPNGKKVNTLVPSCPLRSHSA